jgi:pyruvate dehydrogenase E1 component beta subunit
MKFNEAINDALYLSMKKDKNVIILGLGVDDPKRVFGTTHQLLETFGRKRVFDMPTAENSMTGIALGASIEGVRPVISHQRVEFSLLAFEQMINQAAKWHYMSAGKMRAPLVIRMIIGRGWGQGSQHSQSLESIFAHIPGLKVVCPSNAKDAKGLLISSIEDNNPVIFFEHRWLYNTSSYVPQKHYKIKIGKSLKIKNGKDITIVTYSYMVIEVLKALKILKKYKISADVIDLRTLRPLDSIPIMTSVKKTKRVLVVDNGWSTYGVASEIIALISEKFSKNMLSNPIRIGVNQSPIPSTRALAQYCYPDSKLILKSIEKIFKIKIHKKDFPNLSLEETDVPDETFTGPF